MTTSTTAGPSRTPVLGRTGVAVVAWAAAVVLLGGLAVVAASGGSELSRSDVDASAVVVGLVTVSLQAFVLRWQWDRPGVALVAVAAAAPVGAALGLGAATGVTSVAVLLAAYATVVDTVRPRPVAVLVGAAALVGLGELVRAVLDVGWSPGVIATAVLQGAGTVGLAAAVGALVRVRRETVDARTGRDLAVAAEQTALAQAAVARERVAMARELHDIAAHHLSGIAVMTGAIDRQIDTDPEAAKTAVRQVRTQTTAMLRDLRSLVALLRDDDRRGAHDVAPETLDGVPALVTAARESGRDVSLRLVGTSADRLGSLRIGPLAQLAAYRTVQEALANAARHAPGARAEVVVDVRPDVVVVTVRNDRVASASLPGRSGGLGLVGMRERAELTDARLSVGPDDDGGWTVNLTIPTEPTEDAG